VIGSVREGRFADKAANWFYGLAKARDELDVELVDLHNFPRLDGNATAALCGEGEPIVVLAGGLMAIRTTARSLMCSWTPAQRTLRWRRSSIGVVVALPEPPDRRPDLNLRLAPAHNVRASS
jgi:hypothetical protein